MENPMLRAALEYLRRGWSVVPLCWPGHKSSDCPLHGCKREKAGKVPIVDVEEYRSRLPTMEEINGWWERWPSANVGVLTGKVSGIVAWDIDDEGGQVLLRELTGGAIPVTWTYKTGGGGFRLLYAWPAALPAPTRHLKTKTRPLSFFGEDGGIAMPPSIHHSGSAYEWLREREPGQIPLAEITPLMVEIVERPKLDGRKPRGRPGEAGGRAGDEQRWRQRARAYAERFDPALAGAGGHSVAYTLACALVHGFGLGDDDALSVMQECWNERCEPPWSERELVHKIRSARERGTFVLPEHATKEPPRPPRKGRGAAIPRAAPPGPAPDPNAAAAPREEAPVRRTPGRLATEIREKEYVWAVEPWIQSGELTFVVGEPGSGKSTVGAWLLAQVKRSVVLPGDEEDSGAGFLRRLKVNGVDLASVLVLDDDEYCVPSQREKIAGIVAAHGATLLWIDPIDDYMGLIQENDGPSVREALRAFVWIAHYTGAAVVCARHPGKVAGNLCPGSRQWRAVPRMILECLLDEGPPLTRILRPWKDSPGKDAPAREFRLTGERVGAARLEWGTDVARAEARTLSETPDRLERTKIREACVLLAVLLKGGRQDCEWVYQCGARRGLNDRCMRRAYERLGCTREWEGQGRNLRTWWSLPTSFVDDWDSRVGRLDGETDTPPPPTCPR